MSSPSHSLFFALPSLFWLLRGTNYRLRCCCCVACINFTFNNGDRERFAIERQSVFMFGAVECEFSRLLDFEREIWSAARSSNQLRWDFIDASSYRHRWKLVIQHKISFVARFFSFRMHKNEFSVCLPSRLQEFLCFASSLVCARCIHGAKEKNKVRKRRAIKQK